MITTAKDYFQKITNSQNILCDMKNEALDRLHTSLHQAMSQNSPFVHELQKMSATNKIRLIKALTHNNPDEIEKLLYDLIAPFHPSIERSTLRQLTQHTRVNQENEWLNPTVIALLQTMLTIHTPIDNARMIQHAMQQIPDQDISIHAKSDMVGSFNSVAAGMIKTFSYVSPLPSMNENKLSGNLSLSEYYQICKDSTLDQSEFIVLTTAVLKSSQHPHELDMTLASIYDNYDKLEYKKAMDNIKTFCDDPHLFKESKENDKLKDFILQREKSCLKPKSHKNYSRRFYENRLIQLGAKNIELAQVNKVSKAISGVVASSLDELPTLVNAALYTHNPQFKQRNLELSEKSARFKSRDKVRKSGTLSTVEEKAHKQNDAIWSQNPGVMTSNQPNFVSELASFSMRNKNADKFAGKGRSDPHDKSHLSAYVSSMSGHVFHIVVLLEQYMEENKSDPLLESDVNQYIKALISSYTGYGYHSISEIQEVFAEPHVIDIFKKYNVKLDLSATESVTRQAFTATQEYAKQTCLKRTTLSEISMLRKKHSQRQEEVLHACFKRLSRFGKSINKELNTLLKSEDSPEGLSPQEREWITNLLTQLNKEDDQQSCELDKNLMNATRLIEQSIRHLNDSILQSGRANSIAKPVVEALFQKMLEEKAFVEQMLFSDKNNTMLSVIRSRKK